MTTMYKAKVHNLKIHFQLKASCSSSKEHSSNDTFEITAPVPILSNFSGQDFFSVLLDDITKEEKLLHDIIEMQKLLSIYMEINEEQNLKQIVSNNVIF